MNALSTFGLLAALLWSVTPARAQAPQHIGRLDVHSPTAEAGTYLAGVSHRSAAPVAPPEGHGPFPLLLARSRFLPDFPEITPDMGCNAYPYENESEVPGRVLLVRDGGCDLASKYLKASDSGAAGIVIFANDVGAEDDSTLRTIYWAPDVIVGLYGLYVTRFRGERLRAALLAGEAVTVTLRSEPSTAGEPTPGVERAGIALAAWPNPTRGTATLQLSLDRPQSVRVEVFDTLGRRVAVLHEGTLATGPHTLPAHLATLRAGAYVVRATGDDGAVTRPLLVTR